MPLQTTFKRTTLLALSALLFLCGGFAHAGTGAVKGRPLLAAAQAAQSDCTTATDADIVAAIQEKIKADKRFDDQRKHINVSSENRVVTLSGWAKGRAQVKDLIKLARTTACVKRVVSRLKNHLTVGCGAGQKPCGDTCIDRSQTCNLIQ